MAQNQTEAQKKADKVAADKVAADKVAADKVAAAKADDKVAADKVAADKVAAAKADEDIVAKGKALTSKKGMLSEGDEVKPEYLGGGAKAFAEHVAAKVIVKRG